MGVSCTQKKVNAVVVPCIIPPEEKKGTSVKKKEKVVDKCVSAIYNKDG